MVNTPAPHRELQDHTRWVKERLREYGFTHVGIAAAEPLRKEQAYLLEWLERGFHAGMNWLAREPEKRSDVTRLLADARSVVCVGMNYYTPGKIPENDDAVRISRYAWGDDYHEIMLSRLERFRAKLDERFPGVSCKIYVDTGPVMEKAWAARSGIGWQGKHTNIITRDAGSWIFLGVIVSTLELLHDSPALDYCGTCRACIDACPTGAIVEPYILDSNLCISYQTIENRGDAIPDEVAEKLEGWIFGCDICQDVCPWNSFSKETTEPGFAPRPGILQLGLREAMNMTDEDFRRRFRGSPVSRARPRGFRRNAGTVYASRSSYQNDNC